MSIDAGSADSGTGDTVEKSGDRGAVNLEMKGWLELISKFEGFTLLDPEASFPSVPGKYEAGASEAFGEVARMAISALKGRKARRGTVNVHRVLTYEPDISIVPGQTPAG